MHTYECVYPSAHPFSRFLAQANFFRKLRNEMQSQYSVQTAVSEINGDLRSERSCYSLQLRVDNEDKLRKARNSLEGLIAAITTKIFDDRSGNHSLFNDTPMTIISHANSLLDRTFPCTDRISFYDRVLDQTFIL